MTSSVRPSDSGSSSVVEPAFDQPGGGVEVLFPKGTRPNKVTGSEEIPNERHAHQARPGMDEATGSSPGVGDSVLRCASQNGRELKNAMVFNAEDLEVPDEFAKTEIQDVTLHTS